MSKVITIASQKGGVGKTTTAVNLGASLGVFERKTLVVGIDPQCGLWLSFGRNKENLRGGVYDAVVNSTEPAKIIHGTEIEFLNFIPANIWSNEEETRYLTTITQDILSIKRIIDKIKDDYEYVLVDCPPSLGAVTVAGMAAADYLLVPVQSEYFALKTIGRLIRAARVVGRKYNPNLKLLGFLLTMVDSRTAASVEVVKSLQDDLKGKVFNTKIPRNVRLSEVPKLGKPVVLFDVVCPGAKAHLDLTREVIEKTKG
ncbi:MAG: ParA family protein [Deltaproteobacteria bacterium]|uniref:ParA family protein n=1 Tax=Candidatus Zymogenus saltonus TaxID=2844893 RepID=A0A9D8KE51_9DELT|nr:ParA family protein [Candidatus Zymogenus saltonus]